MLIHSAGGLLPAGARNREGVDRGFAQNFLGAFLLTRLLEERLLASAPARVIAVGSGAHRLLKSADIDALMRPGNAALPMGSSQTGRYQMRSYRAAKLAVTTWIYRLARRWAGPCAARPRPRPRCGKLNHHQLNQQRLPRARPPGASPSPPR